MLYPEAIRNHFHELSYLYETLHRCVHIVKSNKEHFKLFKSAITI